MNVPTLVDVVGTLGEDRQRMARLLLRELRCSAPEMNLGERRHRLRSVGLVADLERERERLLQVRDRDLGLAEQVAQATEVVDDARLGLPVTALLREVPGALRVEACKQRIAAPLGHE